jgi:phosphoribosylformylglycinamidine synthase I
MTARPLALVLRAAGTNCEEETVLALELAGAATATLHLNQLLAEPSRLRAARALVIPGGFSYGDYVAAGRLFGHTLRERLGRELSNFVAGGGRVLGICNGFQVLIELGLLEGRGLRPAQRRIAITANRSNHYECRWVHLRNEESACDFLAPGLIWPVPVAHGEGRVALAEERDLERLREAGQVPLRYVTAEGGEAHYPECPNGSIGQIAGLCDRTGRVLGLMPHPERNVRPWHHPQWTRLPERPEGEGLPFFRGLVQAMA